MDRLEITEYRPGDEHLLVVHGELDIATAPCLTERLAALRDRGQAPEVILDLHDLQFCDSTGLRALLGEAREAEICGGRVRVIIPRDGLVRRLFEVCGVENLLIQGRGACAPRPGRPKKPAARR
jgi:anti-sigma B factor antagonist